MGAKLIQEISYMENTVRTTIGSRLPEEVGIFYHPSKHYAVIGQRFALLLREAGFTLTDFERLVIVFSQALPPMEAAVSDRITDKWMRYVDYGLESAVFNALDEAEKHRQVFDLTYDILLKIFADDQDKRAMVERVAQQIRQQGGDLDIVYQTKSDKVVNVKVILNIFDDEACRLSVHIEDTAGQTLVVRELAQAESLAQALQYAGTILIRKNRVVIKPINNVLTKDLQPVEIGFEL